MKKFLIALLALVMIVSLVACNTSNTATDDTTTAADTDVPVEDSTTASTTTEEDATTEEEATTEEQIEFVPTVFDKFYAENKDKELSFMEAVVLTEDIAKGPLFDENCDTFRIALNAEITAKAKSDAMNSEFSIPVTLVLTATKTGEFALDVTAFEKPIANVTFVGNVLYLSFTDPEGGDTVNLKFDPTEEDLAKLEAALNELLANFNPENIFPVPPSDDGSDTGDVSVPSEITEKLMTELQKLFGEMTPEELSAVLLGKASLAFNEDHSRFYISAQGDFDYLNTTLGKVAAIIDGVLPQDVIAGMEGITFADIFGSFKLRSNSNMIDFIFDAEGHFCGMGIDVGIVGTDSEMAETIGLKGTEADVKLVFELTIDNTLTVTAPEGSADYDVLTVDQIIAMLDEMMDAMGGANKTEPLPDDAASL